MNQDSIVVFKELGRGGNGVVEEVWHHSSAEKTLARKRLDDHAKVEPEILQRFRREARILQSLKHNNVVDVIFAGLDGEDPYFIMPVAQFSLERYVDINGPLSDDRLINVIIPVLEAVEYAHSNGVIHRDIKPENVLWMDEERWVVADFGLGRSINSSSIRATVTGVGRGTHGYAAPEQWTDFAKVNHLADIFGLGSLIYFLTTARSPLVYDNQAAPPMFQGLIRKCRMSDPLDRYENVLALRSDLEQLLLPDFDATPAAERATELLVDPFQARGNRREVVLLYLGHADDYKLYLGTIGSWSQEMVQEQIDDNLGTMTLIVHNLSNLLTGNVPFEDLDDVAEFLVLVYRATEDLQTRELVLTTLLVKGDRYNRWHLGQSFADLASSALASHEAMLIRDVIRRHPGPTAWAESYIRNRVVHPIVGEALNAL